MGDERPKRNKNITYLKKKNIDEDIHQKLRKKDVYEIDMLKIYNIIVVQTNEKLQDEAVSSATFQVVKTGWYPIGYLMVLNMIWF